jgi:hypothetical protein
MALSILQFGKIRGAAVSLEMENWIWQDTGFGVRMLVKICKSEPSQHEVPQYCEAGVASFLLLEPEPKCVNFRILLNI